MTLRGKKIFLKPLNPVKLERYVKGESTISKLLALESAEDGLDALDLSAFHERCMAEPHRSYWHVPWVIIRKKDRRGLAVVSCVGAPNDRYELILTFAEGDDHFEERCEAFELLCEWAAGHDKVYFLRTSLAPSREREIAFVEKRGFTKVEGCDLYECESAPSAWLPVLICAGIGFGAGIGEIVGSMPLGSALGLVGGAFIGQYLDRKNRESRKRE